MDPCGTRARTLVALVIGPATGRCKRGLALALTGIYSRVKLSAVSEQLSRMNEPQTPVLQFRPGETDLAAGEGGKVNQEDLRLGYGLGRFEGGAINDRARTHVDLDILHRVLL